MERSVTKIMQTEQVFRCFWIAYDLPSTEIPGPEKNE